MHGMNLEVLNISNFKFQIHGEIYEKYHYFMKILKQYYISAYKSHFLILNIFVVLIFSVLNINIYIYINKCTKKKDNN